MAKRSLVDVAASLGFRYDSKARVFLGTPGTPLPPGIKSSVRGGELYVPRRQFEKLLGTPLVDSAGRKAAVPNKNAVYNQMVTAYVESKKRQGITVTRRDARQSDELKRVTKALARKQPQKAGFTINDDLIVQMLRDGKYDDSPEGLKAQALVLIGRRNKDWDMPVGESPK